MQGRSSQITTKELNRELANFMNIVDANHDNNVSFKELEDAMFMMKGAEDQISNITQGIVYFANLKEYCSSVIVYEITGVNVQDEFPPPVKWENPEGIETFFKIYTVECGCSRTSLNRQDPKIVQRKLVRVLQNYNFAKFCWESLVEAGLKPPKNPRNLQVGNTMKTRWLLESDNNTNYKQGAMDILASHVQQVTLEKVRQKTSLFRFDTSLALNLDKVILSAGNALIFSKSLLNIGICDTKMFCKLKFVPDSENGWLNMVDPSSNDDLRNEDEKKTEGDAEHQGNVQLGETSSNYGLDVHLETRIYVECLNTTHGVMGMIIEPWSMFLNFGYTIMEDEGVRTEVNDDDDEEEENETGSAKRTSLELKCPDYLKIDFTTETLRTLSLLQNMVQISPEVFDQLSIERNMENLREFWLSVDENDDGLLEKEEVTEIVTQFFGTTWQSMPADQLDEMVEAFMAKVDIDGDGCISFWELEQAVKSRTMNAKSIFESSSLIRFRNTTGHDFYFGSVARESMESGEVSQNSFDDAVNEALDSFTVCHVGRTRPLQLGKDITHRKHHNYFTANDTVSLKFQHFKNINKIQVPAFQKIIFPLTYLKPSQWSPASRFAPTLTIDPICDPLETVTLTVRSSFVIEAHTPINIEIFKVKGLSKSGATIEEQMAHCLHKAQFVLRLDLKEGENAGIPLRVILSNSLHFLRIKDQGQVKWRDPVILDRNFLWNPAAKKSVSKAHLNVGINVARTRLIQERLSNLSEQSRKQSRRVSRNMSQSSNATHLLPTQAWDTTIQVLPSLILSNSLPFNVQFHCFQKGSKGSLFESVSPNSSTNVSTSRNLENRKKAASNMEFSAISRKFQRGRSKSSFQKSFKTREMKEHETVNLTSSSHFLPFNSKGAIRMGGEVKLTGVDLNESVWISISREDGSMRESKPIELDLKAMLGGKTLPIVRGVLEDEVNFKVSGVHMRNTCKLLNIFSPYWVVNKTGMSLSYKVSGRDRPMNDTTLGSAPVLVDSHASGQTLGNNWGGNWIQAIPNQGVYADKLKEWWNEKENGQITVREDLLNCGSLVGKHGGKGISLNPDWCEKIGLDNVGQEGEVNCGNIYFGVSVETMTGAFHESNLMTFYPRFVVRNNYKYDITIVPLEGKLQVSSKTIDSEWKQGKFKNLEINVKMGEASAVYSFSKFGNSGNTVRYIALRTMSSDCSDTSDGKYDGEDFEIRARTHIMPVETLGTVHFAERAGLRVANVIRAKNTKSGATTIINFDLASEDGKATGGQPPYRLENRSSDTTVVVMHDDDDAEPVLLPPMTWSSFAYDNPHSTLRIKAVGLNNEGYGYLKDKISGLMNSIGKPPKRNRRSKPGKRLRNGVSSARRLVMGKSRKERNLSIVQEEESREDASKKGDDSSHQISESDESSLYSSFSLAQNGDGTRFKKIKDRRGYLKALWSNKSRSYNIDKVGRRKDLPSVSMLGKRGDDLFVECRILKGTKVVSFNDSDYRITKQQQDHLRSGGDWMGASTNVKIEGLIINLIDQQPQEILSICLRDVEIVKNQGQIDVMCRLRHLQIDNMTDGARFPIILHPATDSTDEREKEMAEKIREDGASGMIIAEDGDMYWQQVDRKPTPLFEMSLSYLPLQHMTCIPELLIFLNPLKLNVDLAYVLFVVDVVQDALGLDVDSICLTPEEVEEAYKATNKNMEKLVANVNAGQLAYVEKLEIVGTYLQLELFFRQERTSESRQHEKLQMAELEKEANNEYTNQVLDIAKGRKGEWAKAEELDEGNSDNEEEIDNTNYSENVEVSNLNAIGRGTNSTWGASVITWLTNVASSFAQISPIFKFNELMINGHFGRMDDLTENIARHYVNNLLYQSYKLFSFHLLGDPFSLLNSITTGAMQFLTITKDEFLAKGKHGVGGGVKKLVQGVVGGTTKSTAMVFGSAADIISQVAGNGAVMDVAEAKNETGPKHVGEGLMVGTSFFGKHLMKGIVGVLEKPVRGAKEGPVGLATGLVQGVGGLAAAPFIATFGGVSKLAESIDANTHIFDQRIVTCRVRPRRNFGGWGTARMPISVSCIKGIGIRIHNLQYISESCGKIDVNKKTVRLVGADSHKYSLKAKKPDVIQDKKDDKQGRTIEYTVVFEDTIVVRSRDLQVYDELRVEVWDKKLNSSKPLALTYIKVEEILLDIKEFNDEKMRVTKSFYKKNCKMLSQEDVMLEEKREGLEMVSRRRTLSMGLDAEGMTDDMRSESLMLTTNDGIGRDTEDLMLQSERMQRAVQNVTPSVNEHIVYSAYQSEGALAKNLNEVKKAAQMATSAALHVGKDVLEPAVKGIVKLKAAGQRVVDEHRFIQKLESTTENVNEEGGRLGGEIQYLELEGSEQREIVRSEGKPWGVLKMSVFPIEY